MSIFTKVVKVREYVAKDSLESSEPFFKSGEARAQKEVAEPSSEVCMLKRLKELGLGSDLLGQEDLPNATILIDGKPFLARISPYIKVPALKKPLKASMFLKKMNLPPELQSKYKVINFFEILTIEELNPEEKVNPTIQIKGFLAHRHEGLKVNERSVGVFLNFSVVIKDNENNTHLTYCRATNDIARRINSVFEDKEKSSKAAYIYLDGIFTMNKSTKITFSVKAVADK